MCFENFEPEISNEDMTILGSGIGSKQHCENWISQKLDSKMPLLINKLEISVILNHLFFFYCIYKLLQNGLVHPNYSLIFDLEIL